MTRNYIQFTLQELVDIGFYSSLNSARRGFDKGTDVLTSLKVKGTMKKGKKNQISNSTLEVLFTGANIKKSVCTLYLNERINWAFIAAFYTLLPHYCFQLPSRAFDLLYYIFYLARQNVKAIEQRGGFNIGFRALQMRLDLPMENSTKNPYRDIMQQGILDAIEKIQAVAASQDFTIVTVYDVNLPMAAMLNQGYITVVLKGNYAHDFIKLSKEKASQIQAAKKRNDAINAVHHEKKS